MSGPDLTGRVAVVTGAGRGIGRAHAVALAAHGAHVVVNDVGATLAGAASGDDPAAVVVAEIEGAGGSAAASHDDIATEAGAARLLDDAVERFGGLDLLVNNAGILRDRMLVTMDVDDWDAVVAVHLRGTFLTMRHAARRWRALAKERGPVDARIVNTTSVAGLYGNVGQANYVAAKAGIAALTVTAARELERYGVTVNAVSPGAVTRMSEGLLDAERAAGMDPAHVAKAVVWLAGDVARGLTGRVVYVNGRTLNLADGWSAGRCVTLPEHWAPRDLDDVLPGLVADARPAVGLDGRVPEPVVEPTAEPA